MATKKPAPKTPPPPPATPVLDLGLFPARPIVTINQVPYELKTATDLTLTQFRRMETIGREIQSVLMKLGRPNASTTPKEARILSARLDEVCRAVLMAPEPIHQRLGDLHRLAVVKTFSELLPSNLLSPQRTRATPTKGRAPRRAGRT